MFDIGHSPPPRAIWESSLNVIYRLCSLCSITRHLVYGPQDGPGCTATLLDLPDDVLLQVLHASDCRTIILFRRVRITENIHVSLSFDSALQLNRRCCAITRSFSVWSHAYEHCPINPKRRLDRPLCYYSSSQLEAVVVQMYKLEAIWASRLHRPARIWSIPSGENGSSLLLPGGRWLISRSRDLDRPARIWYHDLDTDVPTPITLVDQWVEPVSKYLVWSMAIEIDKNAIFTEFKLAILWLGSGVPGLGQFDGWIKNG